jgi:hypothetical protein
MSAGATVVIDDVLIIRATDLGWLCEIDGERIFVGRLQVAPGTTVPPVGGRGLLALTPSGAHDLGLAHRCRATG